MALRGFCYETHKCFPRPLALTQAKQWKVTYREIRIRNGVGITCHGTVVLRRGDRLEIQCEQDGHADSYSTQGADRRVDEPNQANVFQVRMDERTTAFVNHNRKVHIDERAWKVARIREDWRVHIRPLAPPIEPATEETIRIWVPHGLPPTVSDDDGQVVIEE
jgi:hypothetical protein